ncbi:MAG: daunorubicin resistance protein DrrA family ABC transporter ATP-binding protein [Acidimicrobiales bacterium]|nr:MAG: daunorubicin resistance protein DrrA family ABC transporter ATP-binding protein [Acidimicrobiales bacterium]
MPLDNDQPPRHGLAISAQGLSRTFDANDAVRGLDLAIAPGEIYGFLGPNGAGKSTTVRMLCTLLAPTSGTAHVAGYDIVGDAQQVRLRIGAALQEISLDPRQTGTELLRLQGRFYGLKGSVIDERMRALTTLVDIGDALDRRIDTYSGGMRRRLDLAAALIHEPEVLFLDEPTTGLDPASRARVWEEVRTLNERLGMTILLTTQYLEEAGELAHRVGIINEGRLVAEGTPDELKRQVGRDIVIAEIAGDAGVARDALVHIAGVDSIDVDGDVLRISTADGAKTIGPVAIALDTAGIEFDGLSLRSTSLDDVFLELTGTGLHADAPDAHVSTNTTMEDAR